MSKHILTHSIGAGVQSSTMGLMASAGELPMPDGGYFADTHAEPKSVYMWLEYLKQHLKFPLHVVTAGSLTERITNLRTNAKTGNTYYSNMVPAFIRNADGSKGIVGRACTTNFKIIPIIKALRAAVGPVAMKEWRSRHSDALKAISEHRKEQATAKREKRPCRSRFPKDAWDECQADALVVQCIGISLDEVERLKPARDPWIRNEWPLVDLRMTRNNCLQWMRRNGHPEPPRSACSYCPFHSDAEWRRLKFFEPDAFAEAVRVERKIQTTYASSGQAYKIRGQAFLHESLVPLDQVDFSTDEDHGQQTLFKQECTGMCGI